MRLIYPYDELVFSLRNTCFRLNAFPPVGPPPRESGGTNVGNGACQTGGELPSPAARPDLEPKGAPAGNLLGHRARRPALVV